jgi:hypothetical protein
VRSLRVGDDARTHDHVVGDADRSRARTWSPARSLP